MSLVAFAYTTGGGIVGAAATQYVTHIRDRRAARAVVIEQVTKIEAAYAALRLTIDVNAMDVNPLPRLDELLGSLEATALVAGIPRVFLQPYIDSIKLCYEIRRMEVASDSLTFKIVKNLPTILDVDKSLDPAKAGKYVREAIELIKNLRDSAADADEHLEHLPRSSLRLLSMAIWHPFIIQVRRRKASKIVRIVEDVDRWRQQLVLVNRKLEGKPDLTSYVARQFGLTDEAGG